METLNVLGHEHLAGVHFMEAGRCWQASTTCKHGHLVQALSLTTKENAVRQLEAALVAHYEATHAGEVGP